MKEFLYCIQAARPEMLKTGPTPQESELVSQHFAYLQRLLSEGTLILAGRTLEEDENSFGIVIFRAPDEAAARQIMGSDPAVHGGVMRAHLHPYRVALMATRV